MDSRTEIEQLEQKLAACKAKSAELEKQKERFELAMKFAGGGYFDWNLVTNEIYFSPGWKALLGYEDHEIPNEFSEWERLTDPDDVKKSWTMLEELLAKKRDRFEAEFKMLHKDGHWVDILSRANLVYDESGKAHRVVGSHSDITERKRFQAELRDSEELFKALFRQSGGYAMILKPHPSGIPTILEVNDAACKAHGWTREEMIGRPVADLDDEEGKRLCAERTKIIMSGETLRIETDHIRKDGTVFPVAVCANVVHFENNPPLILTVEYDITELRKAEANRLAMEKQLAQAQKLEAVGVLAGGLAHDFNNLLSIITGNVSLLLSEIDEKDEMRQALMEVQEGAVQAQTLTQQLLTFAKGGEPIRAVTDINPIIEKAAVFATRGKRTRCEFDFSADLWPSFVDAGQINQTISNLVINSTQAMPDGGVVTIRTDNVTVEGDSELPLAAGEYVKIEVEDEGIGISQRHISRIFDPYFSTKQEGSGLGLATSFSIVQKHGGVLSVQSELDVGTVFTIFLPATKEAREQKAKKETKPHVGNGRVLILDDQKYIRTTFSRLLAKLGYEVVCTAEGSKTIEVFKEALASNAPFNLVILDLTVPAGMGGAETLPELRKLDSQVKAIVASGYSNDPVMANYADYGFDGVLTKPFKKRSLDEVLNEVMGEKS